MDKSPNKASKPVAPPAHGYFEWSRDPAVGLFAVLPLWILYEILRSGLTPQERNGAEILLLGAGHLWPGAGTVLRVVFGVVVLSAAVSIHRRQLPWVRVAMVAALEGTVYGLLLGPLSSALATSSFGVLEGLSRAGRLLPDLVGALGAGIFEELLFRLGLMSLLTWLLIKPCLAFSLPRYLAVVGAIVISAVLFSWFHHLPPAQAPFALPDFLFRTAAGLLLGILFACRGFGVCVYTHAMYDVHYYLTHG